MRKFDNIPLWFKLPALLVGLCTLVAIGTALISFWEFRHSMLTETQANFATVQHAGAERIQRWHDRVENDLEVESGSLETTTAIRRLSGAYQMFGEDAQAALQKTYIDTNPNPAADRARLERPEDGTVYAEVHNIHHGAMRNFLEHRSYSDMALISPAGDVVYTVQKLRDFATNLVTGPYSESGLAEAFRRARETSASDPVFVDFAPYAPAQGTPVAFAAVSLLDDSGELLGVLAYRLPLSHLTAMVSEVPGLGDTGGAYVVNSDGRLLTPLSGEGALQAFEKIPADIALDSAAEPATETGHSFDFDVRGLLGEAVVRDFAPVNVDGVTWDLAVEKDVVEVMQRVDSVRNLMLIQIVISALAIGVIGFLVSRTITIPLNKVRGAVERIAESDYDINIRAESRADEIGQIARTVLSFRDKLARSDAAEQERQQRAEEQRRVMEQLSSGLDRLAEGDLAVHFDEPFPGDYEQLRQDFHRAAGRLSEAIVAVGENAGRIRGGADEISQASDDLSRRTENQAATLEQTAAALDELTSSVKSAAEGAREVESIVTSAKSQAEESGEVVRSAVSAMTEIEKSSEQISQIIGVIDDIAFQTNLLALNAGVEAARAGEAGKGFAVVASEVRALAQRSSDAAKEIKTLIGGSSQQVERGVTLVGRAGEALTSIADRVNHISDLVTNIANGAQEQSTGLGEINLGVTQLDQVTQQNAAMVEEATAAAHSLTSEALRLVELMQQFDTPEGQAAPAQVAQFVEDAAVQQPARAAAGGGRTASQDASEGVWQDF